MISILGVILASWLNYREYKRLHSLGHDHHEINAMLNAHSETPSVNWWILGGGLAFTIMSIAVGLTRIPAGEEIVFVVSMTIVIFLMWRLTQELEPEARNVLVGTAIMIFVKQPVPPARARRGVYLVDDR